MSSPGMLLPFAIASRPFRAIPKIAMAGISGAKDKLAGFASLSFRARATPKPSVKRWRDEQVFCIACRHPYSRSRMNTVTADLTLVDQQSVGRRQCLDDATQHRKCVSGAVSFALLEVGAVLTHGVGDVGEAKKSYAG